MHLRTTKRTSNRVSFLRERDAVAVQEAFLPDALGRHAKLARQGSPSVFDRLLAFDPTPKAIYLSQILKWFLAGKIRIEDGRRIRKTLSRFHSRKHALEIRFKDIGRFNSPGDIDEMFFDLQRGGKNTFLSVPEEVAAGSTVMASGEDWTIARLDDFKASHWWADSTSWCTRHRETYEAYITKGPLYVLYWKGHKFQLSPGAGQLMDRFDRPVRPGDFPPGLPREALMHLLDLYVQHRHARTPGTRRVVSESFVSALLTDDPAVVPAIVMDRDGRHLMAIGIRNGSTSHTMDVRTIVPGEANAGSWPGRGAIRIRDTGDLGLLSPEELDNVRHYYRSIGSLFGSGEKAPMAGHKASGNQLWGKAQEYLPESGIEVEFTLIYRDGRVVAMVGPARGKHNGMLATLTLDGPPGLPRLLRSPSDIEALPEYWRETLRGGFAGTLSDGVTLFRFGKGLFDADGLHQWLRSEEGPRKWQAAYGVINHLQSLTRMSVDQVDDILDLAFPEESDAISFALSPHGIGLDLDGRVRKRLYAKTPEWVGRLCGSIKFRGSVMVRKPGSSASVVDLIQAAEFPGTGHLMAALDPKERTAELVDMFLNRGRGGVLGSLPVECCTPARVEKALLSGEADDNLSSESCISHIWYEAKRAIERITAKGSCSPKMLAHITDVVADMRRYCILYDAGEFKLAEACLNHPEIEPVFGHRALTEEGAFERAVDFLATSPHSSKISDVLSCGFAGIHEFPFPVVAAWANVDPAARMQAHQAIEMGSWAQIGSREKLISIVDGEYRVQSIEP